MTSGEARSRSGQAASDLGTDMLLHFTPELRAGDGGRLARSG
ncbi:MAG TPA: hypothetical protein VH307_13715 [Streptosporangiaceae bacterium]|nr:hypothetical protein [Streptosporangiaceae bacterium]